MRASDRTLVSLSAVLSVLGAGVTLAGPDLWELGVALIGLGLLGGVYTYLSLGEDQRQDASYTRLRRQARSILLGLIGEGKSLHSDPGYYHDCSSALYVVVKPATPSANLTPHKEFVAKVEHEWRVRFSERLNACPFKEGTGTVFLDDQGNRLDQALARLQDILHHLDAHIDFERCE